MSIPSEKPAGWWVPFGKATLLVGLVILSIAATRRLIAQARAEFAFEYSTVSDQLAVAPELDPAVADYAKSRGDFWLKVSVPAQLDLAALEYRKAVELNPYEAFHWSDWGQVCWHLGQIESAERAFVIAESLDPNNYVIQRDIGDFYLAQQQIGMAAQHHALAIKLNSSLARSIYAVYWNLGESPMTIAESLLGGDVKLLRRYFEDCLAWVSPEEAEQLWSGLGRPEGGADQSSLVAYFDFLIAHQRYPAAKELWRQIANQFYHVQWDPEQEILWNGSFDLPLLFDGGLSWRIAKQLPNGVQAVISSAKRTDKSQCLWLHFDGKDNVAFSHIRHFFFVEPGETYVLRYRVSLLDLTTDNGPYVRLTVYSNPLLRQNGQVVTGTGPRELEQEFTVPPDGQWAEIAICRDRSEKLNARINGDAWFDGFSVELKTDTTSETLRK